MENNFGLILLDSVRNKKENYLGLLRRNGVLVDTKISNEDLTNKILKAMQKSEAFKTETITLMTVLMNNGNNDFLNVEGKFNFDPLGLGSTSTATTATTTKTKKDFADTTVGTIFDKLMTFGNAYLQNKDLDVKKVQAQSASKISENEVRLEELGGTKKGEKDKDKDNTGLYIALGLGGLAVVGLLVFLIVKKK